MIHDIYIKERDYNQKEYKGSISIDPFKDFVTLSSNNDITISELEELLTHSTIHLTLYKLFSYITKDDITGGFTVVALGNEDGQNIIPKFKRLNSKDYRL